MAGPQLLPSRQIPGQPPCVGAPGSPAPSAPHHPRRRSTGFSLQLQAGPHLAPPREARGGRGEAASGPGPAHTPRHLPTPHGHSCRAAWTPAAPSPATVQPHCRQEGLPRLPSARSPSLPLGRGVHHRGAPGQLGSRQRACEGWVLGRGDGSGEVQERTQAMAESPPPQAPRSRPPPHSRTAVEGRHTVAAGVSLAQDRAASNEGLHPKAHRRGEAPGAGPHLLPCGGWHPAGHPLSAPVKERPEP